MLTKLDFGNATLAGLPTNLLNRLQSVLNAAARSIAGLRRSDHVTDTVASFHWFRAHECINFKLAVPVYRALHGTAPRYLSDLLRRVADLPSRRRLRLATSSQLDVRPSRLVTVGDRSFACVGRLTSFSNLIRTLFCSLLWFSVAIVVLEVIYLGHVKKCNVM